MRKLTRRAGAPEAQRPSFSKWHGAGVLAAALFAVGCGAAREVPQRPRPDVTLDDARADPGLRQAYLDTVRTDSGCVAEIRYDTGDGVRHDCERLSATEEDREALKDHDGLCLHGKSLCDDGAIAWVATSMHMAVNEAREARGKEPVKATIHVCPAMFEEKEIGKLDAESILTVHEPSHACDAYNGLTLNGRHYDSSDMTYGQWELLTEMKALAEELRFYSSKGGWNENRQKILVETMEFTRLMKTGDDTWNHQAEADFVEQYRDVVTRAVRAATGRDADPLEFLGTIPGAVRAEQADAGAE